MSDDAPSSNVVQFKLPPPKTSNRTYKSHSYTVTYLPKTKTWKWTVEIVQKIRYSEEAPTQVKAYRAAERFIDKEIKNGN